MLPEGEGVNLPDHPSCLRLCSSWYQVTTRMPKWSFLLLFIDDIYLFTFYIPTSNLFRCSELLVVTPASRKFFWKIFCEASPFCVSKNFDVLSVTNEYIFHEDKELRVSVLLSALIFSILQKCETTLSDTLTTPSNPTWYSVPQLFELWRVLRIIDGSITRCSFYR